MNTKQAAQRLGVIPQTAAKYAKQLGLEMRNGRYFWRRADVIAAQKIKDKPRTRRRTVSDRELIATLRAVHEHGSYAKAGKAMFLDRNAIRYRVDVLQEQHDKPLVEMRQVWHESCGNHLTTAVVTDYGKGLINE